jgi:hypothetical protein
MRIHDDQSVSRNVLLRFFSIIMSRSREIIGITTTNQEVARSSRAGRTNTLRISPLANRSEQRERLVCFVDFWSIFAFPCRRWVHDLLPGRSA